MYNNTQAGRGCLHRYLGFFLILILTSSLASSVSYAHVDLPAQVDQKKTQINYTRYVPSILFQTTWGGPGDDRATGVAVDSTGNTYVTGTTTSFCCGAFLLKFNPTGSLLWQRVLLGNDTSPYFNFVSNALAVDSMGNAYITGYAVPFNGTGQDLLVVKFDSSGNLLWEQTWGGRMNDYGQAIAVDKYGGVYVTGTTFSFANSGYANVVVLKFRANGSLVWQESWGYQFLYNSGSGIALDSSGNLYVSGYLSGSQYGNNNALLLKLNSTGAPLWQEEWTILSTTGFSPYNINTLSSAVTVDSNGTAYVTGYSNYGISGFSYIGVPIIKFDPDGSMVWQKIWIRSTQSYYLGDQNGYAIALDPTGNIFIAGQSINYGQGTPSNGVLILEFSTRGDLEWEATTGTSNSDAGKGVAVTRSGDPILAGNLFEVPPGSLTGLNFAALKGNFSLIIFSGPFAAATNATLSTLNAINSNPSGGLTYSGSGDAYILKLQPPTPSPPSPPLALVAQAGQNNISLSWAPPQYTGGHPVTGYNIYKGLNPGGETLLASTQTAHAYVDSNVKSGVTYYYYVKAVNSLGESDASNENYATPGASTAATISINPTILGGASVLVVAVVGLVVYQRRKRVLHFG